MRRRKETLGTGLRCIFDHCCGLLTAIDRRLREILLVVQSPFYYIRCHSQALQLGKHRARLFRHGFARPLSILAAMGPSHVNRVVPKPILDALQINDTTQSASQTTDPAIKKTPTLSLEKFNTSLVAVTATGDLLAINFAISNAACIAPSLVSKTRETNPHCSASFASKNRAENASSRTNESEPHILGRRCKAPTSAAVAMSTSLRQYLASAEQ